MSVTEQTETAPATVVCIWCGREFSPEQIELIEGTTLPLCTATCMPWYRGEREKPEYGRKEADHA